MSYPRISASWETIGKLKKIAAKHQCWRDDEPKNVPCIGEMLYRIGEGQLTVVDTDYLNRLKIGLKK